MKKGLALVLALLLCAFVFAGCKKSDATSAIFSSQAENWEAEDVAAPDFLDEQQQALYRKAYAAYVNFTFDASFATSGDAIEINEKSYAKAAGAHASLAQLAIDMQKVFTQDYFENKLNIRDDGSWVYTEHEKALFRQISGPTRTYRSDYLGVDTFEIVSQTDGEIQFYVLGHYELGQTESGSASEPSSSSQAPAKPPAPDASQPEAPAARQPLSDTPPDGGSTPPVAPPASKEPSSVQQEPDIPENVEKFLVVLTLVQGEWRFSQFAVSC